MLSSGAFLIAAALVLQPAPQGENALAVQGLPGRGRGYVSWEALRSLPQTTVKVAGELGGGTQEVAGVLLGDVLRGLGAPAGLGVLARCNDGYLSVFTPAFIARYRPLLVLTIAGRPPAQWPPPGMREDPGPYLIVVSDALAPGVSRLRDVQHKQPWGVTELRLVSIARTFAALPRTPLVAREIWINSCASCHAGPTPETPGGTKAGPAASYVALQAIARSNPDFFKQYVRQPTSLVPTARMEPHPYYTAAELDALVAFLAPP